MQIIQTERHKSNNQLGKLTIAIPTWNRADQLLAQLDAIAAAFGGEHEVVVADNGSSDHTWHALCDEVATNRLSLKCLRSPVNCGCDVNYLRALEAATGEWTWLIGDDDLISCEGFKQDILELLDRAKADVVLLADIDSLAHLKGDIFQINVDKFFDISMDFCSGYLLKLSRSIYRTQRALEWIPYAYQHGVGSLHSYSYVQAKLLRINGLDIIFSDLLFFPDPYDEHRWDHLNGHLGAWKTNLVIFRPYKKYVRAREKRLRAHLVLEAAGHKLYREESSRSWIIFVLRELPFKHKLKLLYHFYRSRLPGLLFLRIKRPPNLENNSEY